MGGPNTDKAAKCDTKNLSLPSKELKQKFKNHRVVLIANVHISLVVKITFICFLKSLCSFSRFVMFCHPGHVILIITGCSLSYCYCMAIYHVAPITGLSFKLCSVY